MRHTENGVKCNKFALVGEETCQAIIEAAERNACDLIFMASHGRRGIKGVVLAVKPTKY